MIPKINNENQNVAIGSDSTTKTTKGTKPFLRFTETETETTTKNHMKSIIRSPLMEQNRNKKDNDKVLGSSNCERKISPSEGLRHFIQQQRKRKTQQQQQNLQNNSNGKGLQQQELLPPPVATMNDVDSKSSIMEKELLQPQGQNKFQHQNNKHKQTQLYQDVTHATNRTSNDNKSFFVPIMEDEDAYVSQQEQNNSSPLPVLHIGNFQESVWLNYGDERRNVVGLSHSLSFVLQAPCVNNGHDNSKSSTNTDNADAGCTNTMLTSSHYNDYHVLEVEKVPTRKGFTLTTTCGDCGDNQQGKERDAAPPSPALVLPTTHHTVKSPFYIKAGDKMILTLTWKPIDVGGMRETIYLKMQRGRIRIIAHGKADSKRPTSKQTTRVSIIISHLLVYYVIERHIFQLMSACL